MSVSSKTRRGDQHITPETPHLWIALTVIFLLAGVYFLLEPSERPDEGTGVALERNLNLDDYDPNDVLIEFPCSDGSNVDAITLDSAYRGICVLGGTGSGKTSTTASLLARAFLYRGYGGLVTAAKTEEVDVWRAHADICGCQENLIVVSEDSGCYFNFMDYEWKSAGSTTESVVQLFMKALEFQEGGHKSRSSSDSFWEDSQARFLRNAIDLLTIALGNINLTDIMRLFLSAPQVPEQIDQEGWQQNSFLHQTAAQVTDARYESLSKVQQADYDACIDFFYGDFPIQDHRTRSSVLAGLFAMFDSLSRGLLRELLCTDTNFRPEDSYIDNKVIVLDLPIKRLGPIATVVQGLFKYQWQRTLEKRDIRKHPRPCFLFCDEAHFFTSKYDGLFLSTARSKRVCPVYISQSIPNYYVAVGGGQNGVYATEALLSHFQTLVLHANRDNRTNEWSSSQIGKAFKHLSGVTVQDSSPQQGNNFGNTSTNLSQQLHFLVEPYEFLTFRTGGTANNGMVDAVLVQSGKAFHETGRPYRHITLSQDF